MYLECFITWHALVCIFALIIQLIESYYGEGTTVYRHVRCASVKKSSTQCIDEETEANGMGFLKLGTVDSGTR